MSDGEQQGGPAANLLRSLVGLGGTLLAAAETRVELLTTEISEDLERGVQLLLWAFVALLAGILGALLAGVTIIVYFWDSHRIGAAVCVRRPRSCCFRLPRAWCSRSVAGEAASARRHAHRAQRRDVSLLRNDRMSSRLVALQARRAALQAGVRTAARRPAAASWRHRGPRRRCGPDDRYRAQLRASHCGWRDSGARGSRAGPGIGSAAATASPSGCTRTRRCGSFAESAGDGRPTGVPIWDTRLSRKHIASCDTARMGSAHRVSWSRRRLGWAAALALSAITGAGCGGNGSGGSAPPAMPDTTPPTVPQGVTASALSPTEIAVAWQPSSDAGVGVSGYRVFRDGGAAPVATVTGTSYADRGLAPSTRYSYAVRAFDSASPPNESAQSAAAVATTPAVAATTGLDARPGNPTCVAGERPSQTVTLAAERVFPGLPSFSSPVLMLQAPGNATRWYVVEQGGVVRVFENQPAVATSAVFVNISGRVRSGGEQGLLGMAFHPGYPGDPRVYLSYTNATSGLVSRVSGVPHQDGGQTLDPDSEVILFSVAQPATNHNGGYVAFGPDGFLYAGFGDGGSGGDPWARSETGRT